MFRVLLVEDSPVLTDRIRETFATLDGVELVAAVADESSAVEAASRNSIDAIILDLQLREGTGFGVLERLGRPRPTVIVFTNYVLPEYRRRATELGVEHFLNKFCDYDRLPQLVQELGQRRKRKS